MSKRDENFQNVIAINVTYESGTESVARNNRE